ncbi:MAG: ATP-binding protein [Lachnospiraceae bacterium]|nr:ATP-binding protein [Lachnospiraceae bacterium]
MLVNACAEFGDGRVWVEKQFDALVDNFPFVSAFVEDELEKLACPMKVSLKLAIALEEIYVNIAQYGYENKGGDCLVGVGFNPKDGTVAVRFIDRGVPFNPLEKEDPDITLPAEERGIGGLGIFMVKQISDDVFYKYQDEENILTMIKKIRD